MRMNTHPTFPESGQAGLVPQTLPRMTDSQGPIEALSYRPLHFYDSNFREVLFPIEKPIQKFRASASNPCSPSTSTPWPSNLPRQVSEYLERLVNILKKSITNPPLDDSVFNNLITVAGISRYYGCDAWEDWATGTIRSLVASPESPLLHFSSSEMFARLLQLARIYNDGGLGVSIHTTWLSRLHRHNLPPTFAILIADDFKLRLLLTRALYIHLLNMEPRISKGQPIDLDSPLSHQQNLRILSGYHALSGHWTHLSKSPPEFMAVGECRSHFRCLATWESGWSRAISSLPRHVPDVDVVSRLQIIADGLWADATLKNQMSEGCRASAFKGLSTLRGRVLENLHHYFDL